MLHQEQTHADTLDISSCQIKRGNGIALGRSGARNLHLGAATGGASVVTREAVNGLCRIFRKRPEKFWVSTWGQAKFLVGSDPLAPS